MSIIQNQERCQTKLLQKCLFAITFASHYHVLRCHRRCVQVRRVIVCHLQPVRHARLPGCPKHRRSVWQQGAPGCCLSYTVAAGLQVPQPELVRMAARNGEMRRWEKAYSTTQQIRWASSGSSRRAAFCRHLPRETLANANYRRIVAKAALKRNHYGCRHFMRSCLRHT